MIHSAYIFKNIYNINGFVCCGLRRAQFCTFNCIKCENTSDKYGQWAFFCKRCSWPTDPESMKRWNIYTLFKMDPVYFVDKGNLSQTYKQYQFFLHPDRNLDRTPEELDLITSNSMLVNRFYNTLTDDKKRARYLFDLKYGKEMFEEHLDRGGGEGLEYIMEVHEKVDNITNDSERNNLKEEFRRKIEEVVDKIGISFRNDDPLSVIENYKTLSFYRQIYEKLTQ